VTEQEAQLHCPVSRLRETHAWLSSDRMQQCVLGSVQSEDVRHMASEESRLHCPGPLPDKLKHVKPGAQSAHVLQAAL
jgi:hypothetical protein